jgi:hypothetical protein
VEVVGELTGRDCVEVVVVAVRPVERRTDRLVEAGVGGNVAYAQPQGNVRMLRDDVAGGGEVAVDVA